MHQYFVDAILAAEVGTDFFVRLLPVSTRAVFYTSRVVRFVKVHRDAVEPSFYREYDTSSNSSENKVEMKQPVVHQGLVYDIEKKMVDKYHKDNQYADELFDNPSEKQPSNLDWPKEHETAYRVVAKLCGTLEKDFEDRYMMP